MKAQFLARLRADAGVAAVAGTIPLGQGTRPAVDWMERRSDDASAFPAARLQVISGATDLTQDGPTRFQQPRIRVEAFGRSYAEAREFFEALKAAIETPGEQGGVRFHQAQMLLERDLPPEKQNAQLTIYRTVGDFRVPATTTGE